MSQWHSLLKRQIKKYFGDDKLFSPDYQRFLEAVNSAYLQSDIDRAMLERSLEISSEELIDANSGMRALYERIIQNSIDGIFAYDLDSKITVWNPGMERLTNIAHADTYDKNTKEIEILLNNIGAKDCIARTLVGETVIAQEIIYIEPGSNVNRYFEGHFAPIRNKSDRIIGGLAIIRDVTDRKWSDDVIQHQAYHDALTNLPNRLLFVDRLNQAMSRSRWNGRLLAVMFLDLDQFKRINDTLGHTIGDELLKEVANRISNIVRDGDTVCRLGGDEFAILLTDIAEKSDMIGLAQNLMSLFSVPMKIKEHELFVTSSIGITMYPTDGEDIETLLRNSDIAMYRAKERGRNGYQFFLPEMNKKVSERLAMENDLRHAIENGDFCLHYQPQLDIKTGKIFGVEALIRWQHKDHKLIAPNLFIPLAEETGLIVPLGDWVLEAACKQVKIWHDMGYSSIRMAVNLSTRQFQQPNLIEKITKTLSKFSVHPKYLELEMTESILQNFDVTLPILKNLKATGVEISIDDFGTGYSSLNYLKHLPIDRLKIDQSFIMNITTDKNDAAIVRTIITLAHQLDLQALAEGVETRAQLDFLKTLNCDEMQGYYFSAPVPAREFTELLEVSAPPEPPKELLFTE